MSQQAVRTLEAEIRRQMDGHYARPLDNPELELAASSAVLYDDDGRPRVQLAECGECARRWNDAAISSRTPAPSARCPFEYEHEDQLERATGGTRR